MADFRTIGVDKFFLAYQISPGRCIIKGASSPRKWNVNDGFGQTGASVVFGGEKLSSFEIELQFWEPEHLDEWQDFKSLCEKPPTGTIPKALDIYHPILADLKITSVVVEDRTQLDLIDETGLWSTTIKFIQYKKPRPILAKPVASIPNAAVPVPTAQDAGDRMIAALYAKFQAGGE